MKAIIPIPDPVCPLCGGPNDCGPARCGNFEAGCWCADVVIADQALDRIPPSQRGRSCLCRACATAAPLTAPPDPG